MIELEQYFRGQESWKNFSEMFEDDWTNSELQIKLLSEVENRIDIAKVIYYHIGNGSLNWLNIKVPALDNLTPTECLKSEKLINRLKECLMRMQ